MSEERRSDQVIWHDEIEVGKWRNIAARGLTPNHRGVLMSLPGLPGHSLLLNFRHDPYAGTTEIDYLQNDRRHTVSLPFLTAIDVQV